MIHWLWLIPTLMVGGGLGVAIMCAVVINKESEHDTWSEDNWG